MPTRPAGCQPENRSGSPSRDHQLSAEHSHFNHMARTRTLSGGYIATHPILLRVLEWLGWNNPGGSMNQ
jgi:hypothetical protein